MHSSIDDAGGRRRRSTEKMMMSTSGAMVMVHGHGDGEWTIMENGDR